MTWQWVIVISVIAVCFTVLMTVTTLSSKKDETEDR